MPRKRPLSEQSPAKKISSDAKELREIVDAVRDFELPDDFLLSTVKTLPLEPPNMLPSEWAEKNRYLTKVSTPFPGKFKWARSPFWREPLDRLSPTDPTQKIAVMKGTQVGFTAAFLENAIGFGMACDPQPILFVSGDEKLISRAKKTRIDPMIDNSGLRQKIRPDSLKKGVKRTGDSGGMMEFAGGFLTLCGPGTESSFQGLSYRMLLLDEVDLYPYKLGRSGETVKVIEARADAFKSRKKMVYGSRPTVAYGISEMEKSPEDEADETAAQRNPEEVGSRILELYQMGDQRKYHVPCPHCKGLQELVFFKGTTHDGISYGLMFDSEACKLGDFSSVKYQCRHCGQQFEEYYKTEMIQAEAGATWVPTAKAKEPYFVSYHMSAIYSLTVEWWEIVKEFLQAKGDPSKMQLFFNRYLGLPFEDRSGGLEITKVSERAGGYARNSIPKRMKNESPLFLTAACDVQTGTKGRVECEIKAWGRNWRNWSIDYRIFKGTPEDKNDECWKQVAAVLDEKWRGSMQVERMFLDSSDGNMMSTVYDVCRMYGKGESALMIPIKGQPVTARTRHYQKVVELANERFPLVEIYSDNYKNKLASWLRQDWRPGEAAPIGWAEFPAGYDREYFRQLTTEERVTKRIGKYLAIEWVKHGRNESWDIFVYNTACADFVIEDYSTAVLGLDKADPEAVWQYFESLRD